MVVVANAVDLLDHTSSLVECLFLCQDSCGDLFHFFSFCYASAKLAPNGQ